MSDDSEKVLLKVRLRNIAMQKRLNLTEKYITELVSCLRSRAHSGFTSYRTEPLPDNICKDQLKEWFKEEKMIMHVEYDGSILIHW